MKYVLKHPITWDSKEITEVDFKTPKMKHYKKIKTTSGVEDLLKIAASLTGISMFALEEMHPIDGMAITGIVGGFLEDGRETGLS